MPALSFESPVGPLCLEESQGAIVALRWGQIGDDETVLLQEARRQIGQYFNGLLVQFDLPLSVSGSVFQQSVCNAMSDIPFGETRTYGDIARELGVPAQAVGQACGGNPIPIIIPCHRVLSSTGLGGFSGDGGVETKVALLKHEGAAGLLI